MDLVDRKEFETVANYLEGKLNECGKRRKRVNSDSPKQLEQMINTIKRALAIDKTSDSGLNTPCVNYQLQLIEKLENYIEFIGEELSELAVLASNRGWESTRIQRGEELRKEIKELKLLL